MPFAVASYTPDPSSIKRQSKGRALGLEHRGKHLHLVSKTPIRVIDDQACLRHLDLTESDDDYEGSSRTWRESDSVSRNFYKEPSTKKNGSNLVDERLIELLERMPKNKRISLQR